MNAGHITILFIYLFIYNNKIADHPLIRALGYEYFRSRDKDSGHTVVENLMKHAANLMALSFIEPEL